MKYEVGQPVWVQGTNRVVKAKFYKMAEHYGKDACLVYPHGEDVSVIAHYSNLSPRPTLYWTVREWFMSLVGKK